MIAKVKPQQKEDGTFLDSHNGSEFIDEHKDESANTGRTSRLSKLLEIDDKISSEKHPTTKPSLNIKPPEDNTWHQSTPSADNYYKSHIGTSILSKHTENKSTNTDVITEEPFVLHHRASPIGGESNWIKHNQVFPVLLVLFVAMLTFMIVQFCLNKKSLIKSGKKKSNQSKKSAQTFQCPPQVSVVRGNGSESPVTQSWARKSISASRQCAIDIEESSNDSEASASSADEKSKRAPKSLGSLKYRLTYDFAQSLFAVTILEAKGLPGMDLCGSSDPYVKVYFLPSDERPIQKTKVKKRNLNPVFEETFEFNISYPQLVSKTLVLAVFDYDRFSRHDHIGQISLPMNTIELAEITERWQPLERLPGSKGDDKLGDLCLGLRYVPNSGKLTVIVMEARALKKMDLAGLSDPFVKLALYIDGKRVKKKKTEIKKCTLNPQFNESFSFEVSSEQMKTAQLRVTVIDYDRIGVSDPIGGFVLACTTDASGETESRHWMDMLASPRRQISRWHSLRPHL